MQILKQAVSILINARMIGDISSRITINLDKLKIWLSTHAEERLYRHETGVIKETEIIETIKKALQPIINDFANGTLSNHSEILITNSSTDLNIVGALTIGRQGQDIFEVITVMKKKNFIPKSDTAHYTV
jgi:hypothetical protein